MMNPQALLHHAWLVPFLPLAAFVLILVTALGRRALSAGLSILALAGSFLLAALLLAMRCGNPGAPPMELEYRWIFIEGGFNLALGVIVDNLSASMLTMVSLVALLVQIYSTGYMRREGDGSWGRYFAFMSLFAASMLGLVVSGTLLGTYLCWELVGLSSYLLIGFWYEKKEAADAAKKAFVVTRFGDLGLLLAVVAIAWTAGLQSYSGLASFFTTQAPPPFVTTALALLIFCGAVGKSAQFPLHVWLPDAMEGPTPVSALIHAATMVAAGVYLVARTWFVFHGSPEALGVVAAVGAITLVISGTMALVQSDIKRVLAYSTISQLGYMMLALGAGGYAAGLFHLFTHAFFKALLFLCAGAVIHSLGTNDLRLMGGLKGRMPWTRIAFLAGCLALAGIPPFSGFFSKDAILSAVVRTGSGPLIFAAFLGAALTGFYVFRAYALAFLGQPRSDEARRGHDGGAAMTAPLAVLALLAVFSGFLGMPGRGDLVSGFLDWGAAPEGIAPLASIGGTVLALAGALGGLVLYRRGAGTDEALRARFPSLWRLFEEKWYLDRFWEWAVGTILFGASRLASLLDERAVDGVVAGVAAFVELLGRGARALHDGQVQRALLAMALGLLMLCCAGALLSRPGFLGLLLGAAR